MNLIWARSISLDSTFKLFTPGVLHGPVPAGRAENHLPENHHSGHEKAPCRLQVHLHSSLKQKKKNTEFQELCS
jgi:hypothetical protein